MNRKKKIYIAGKVTGLPYGDVKQKFRAAENQLHEQGYQVVNPTELYQGTDWDGVMNVCLNALADCDAIYMLTDWANSRIATLEHTKALELRIPIHFQTEGGLHTLTSKEETNG